MIPNLLELKTNELLKRYGAGSHKPGSGSAVALQGLLSAQLLLTVASITCEKVNLKEHHPRFATIIAEIRNNIYPQLEGYHQEDSVQFGKAIKARKKRDEAKSIDQRAQLAAIAIEELKPAVEIPIEIAKCCLELAAFANTTFDYGFQSARGDTIVALNAAIASVAGCLSIIDLNLLSFGRNEWTDGVRKTTKQLKFRLEEYVYEATLRLNKLSSESDTIAEFYQELDNFRAEVLTRKIDSDADIEKIAQSVQRAIWRNYKIIWKKQKPADPVDMLDPKLVIELLGYQFAIHDTLGQHEIGGILFDVAGQIDCANSQVSISAHLPLETHNFTVAHELAHALLHPNQSLHRDRPLDGSTFSGLKDKTERQADKFATFFLMPSKLVRERFKTVFLSNQFIVDDETAFALNFGSVAELRKIARTKNGLARILATTNRYNGKDVTSLTKQFKVSAGAMAIRLEELDLLGWD